MPATIFNIRMPKAEMSRDFIFFVTSPDCAIFRATLLIPYMNNMTANDRLNRNKRILFTQNLYLKQEQSSD